MGVVIFLLVVIVLILLFGGDAILDLFAAVLKFALIALFVGGLALLLIVAASG